MAETTGGIGASPIRKEGRSKVLGEARYIDDLSLPGMWFGATVRSTIARGRIRKITFGIGVNWDEYCIVSARDIPGENTVIHLTKDHPCLADEYVNHPEEPILLLAHPEKHALLHALKAIQIDYEEFPGVFTIEESEQAVADGDVDRIIWDGSKWNASANCFKTYTMYSGEGAEVEAGLAEAFDNADFIVTGEYHTGAQEQLYIENNGVIAECFRDADGNVESVCVQGSMQCPYYLVHALTEVFHLPEEKCRVIQVETGGAFGGKEDFPSVIGSHAALLAMKSGHPVKITYDRAEDMAATTKRHPSRTRLRVAVTKEGKLLGAEIDVAIDGGAYSTLSPVVLSRATIHAPGPYKWPFIRVKSKAMATNIPPHGAFRGFGAPQSLFGLERHMDKIAKTIGISPEELRRRNFLGTGDCTATGQPLVEEVDMQKLLTRALDEAGYHEKIARYAEENKTSPIKRGVGFATFMHGTGFTGSGERRLNSLVHLDLLPDGTPQILVSSTEFGQGTNTILCQAAASALQLPYDQINIARPDTSVVPNSGPTVASRTAMIVGKLVQRVSEQMLHTLRSFAKLPENHTPEQFQQAALAYLAEHGPLRESARYEPPTKIYWDDALYRGDAYPGYAWAVYVAEVALDTRTYTATCTQFDALQEVGRVMHPVLAKGQVEGGVAQGIGYALYEKCVWKNGRMMNNQMTNYIMPTSADLPPIYVHFEEVPSIHGPNGAKGIGELPMDGPAPAILNAIENATGVSFNTIPLLPEDIYERYMSLGHPHGGTEDLDPTTDRDTRVETIA
ncbi:xanthine dehydrogenase family protein molybdopterin-binding subunit [Granulicella cerasi]|uniref:Xanthine dehydrogenase family protein molybdopterin-binding subunit n=1 Tax=Granulicella cerasi TaxID=741063 RepID=A0ABW1ZAM0_9BACT|nr:xanthine dehydrogenase family protein molybdopterin-binding subunit [Granulicella cerasi]